MSSIIQQEERKIAESKQRIKSEKIRDAKEAIKEALKRNDDNALQTASIRFYALSKNPSKRKATTDEHKSPLPA